MTGAANAGVSGGRSLLHPESRVLVTGGAGFIGSALVWGLNRQGVERIVIADRLGTDDKWRNLVPLRFEDYVEAPDAFAARVAAGAYGNFDLVLHLAACSATTERDSGFLARNNYEFTRDLARWAVAAGTRFVYASSAATYGDGSAGMSDADQSAEALSRLRPLNAYGWSKHAFDVYAARAGLLPQIVGLKYFNVFGPNEAHKGEMRSLVDKAFAEIRDAGAMRLFRSHRPDYADGAQRRDFLYVKDAVAMTLHLADARDAGGLFNIGSGVASTWLELAAALYAALGRAPKVEFVEMPVELRERYQYFTCAVTDRLRAAGYGAAPTPLETAVQDYVRNYLVPHRRLGDEESGAG